MTSASPLASLSGEAGLVCCGETERDIDRVRGSTELAATGCGPSTTFDTSRGWNAIGESTGIMVRNGRVFFIGEAWSSGDKSEWLGGACADVTGGD